MRIEEREGEEEEDLSLWCVESPCKWEKLYQKPQLLNQMIFQTTFPSCFTKSYSHNNFFKKNLIGIGEVSFWYLVIPMNHTWIRNKDWKIIEEIFEWCRHPSGAKPIRGCVHPVWHDLLGGLTGMGPIADLARPNGLTGGLGQLDRSPLSSSRNAESW